MINLKDFQKQLELVKKDYNLIDESIDKFLKNNPFICDGGGVASEWLLNIIVHSLKNLFLAVNPNASMCGIDDLIDYYLWEGNFGGKIDTFDLSDNKALYNYIKTLKGK